MWFPADWPSPIASAQPYAPGASSTPSVIRSTCAIGSAPARGRRGGQRRRRLETAEEVRLREDRAGGARARSAEPLRVGRAAGVRHLHDLHAEPRRERAHHLAHLRVQRLGDHDPGAARRLPGDVARVGGDRHPVVAGCVGDVHPGQLADRGLVLEDGLERSLAHLRLVGRVGREQLAALHDGVDDRRHVVVVHPGAEERELAARARVAPGQLTQVRPQLALGQRRVDPQRPVEADVRRDLGEQVGDRVHADRGQHRGPVGVGQRGEAHSDSTSSRYAPALISPSTSPGLLRRTLTSQPSP